MRVLCVALPELCAEISLGYAEPTEAGRPQQAVGVVRTAHSSITLQGGHRLAEVNAAAHHEGVAVGMTVAEARARFAPLDVQLVTCAQIDELLSALAEHFLAFGATVAFRQGDELGCSVVLVDVTGCAHLFGSEEALGEQALVRAEELGHFAFGAIADGPRVAEAFAQALVLGRRNRNSRVAELARQGAQKPFVERFFCVPTGENLRHLGQLPVAVLPIPPPVRRWFQKLGLMHIASVQALPRRELVHRLGRDFPAIQSLLDGDDRSPLAAHTPKETLEELLEIEPVFDTAPLIFVARRLAARLAGRLVGRGTALSEISLRLRFEDNSEAIFPFRLVEPVSSEQAIFDLVKAKLEAFPTPSQGADPTTSRVDRAVVLVAIHGDAVVPRVGRAQNLFSAAREKARAALPSLVASLDAELGDDFGNRRVGTLVVQNTYELSERTKLVPYTERSGPAVSAMEVPEPTRLFEPIPLEEFLAQYGFREKPTPLRFLYRYAAEAWWRRRSAPHGSGAPSTEGARDFLLLGVEGVQLFAMRVRRRRPGKAPSAGPKGPGTAKQDSKLSRAHPSEEYMYVLGIYD